MLLHLAAIAVQTPPRPHFVFVLADDLGVGRRHPGRSPTAGLMAAPTPVLRHCSVQRGFPHAAPGRARRLGTAAGPSLRCGIDNPRRRPGPARPHTAQYSATARQRGARSSRAGSQTGSPRCSPMAPTTVPTSCRSPLPSCRKSWLQSGTPTTSSARGAPPRPPHLRIAHLRATVSA